MANATLKRMVISLLLLWERMESGVVYNLTSPKVRSDPYDVYRELRKRDPVHRMRLLKAHLLTGYDDVDQVLRDHKRFSNSRRGFAFTELRTLLHSDPPQHTRLRGLILKAFTSRAVRNLEPRVHAIMEELLDAVETRERFDVMSAVAFPLPIIVISEMLGIPSGDRGLFEDWSNRLAKSVEPVLSEGEIDGIRGAWDSVYEYFDAVIDERRAEPRDDLISSLIAASYEGNKLTHEEVLLTLLLLLVAGNETTRNLIGNGMLALLDHPEQMEELRKDPGLMESAINEMLRFNSPIQLDGRYVEEDAVIGGKRIKAGTQVLCSLGAANRDPEIYSDPDSFIISRNEAANLAFGRGIHYCLGSSLAILEARSAFRGILDRFSSIRLVERPEFRGQLVLRGLKELWVEVVR